ncbi:MAG: hypothetical protein R3B06_12655 [Kofleriaceae bacterium]
MTLDEYRKHIEKDKALERRFQPVLVEPSFEDTVAILYAASSERYEVHHGIRIRDAALAAAAWPLSARYIPARQLPDTGAYRSHRRGGVAVEDGDRERADGRQPRSVVATLEIEKAASSARRTTRRSAGRAGGGPRHRRAAQQASGAGAVAAGARADRRQRTTAAELEHRRRSLADPHRRLRLALSAATSRGFSSASWPRPARRLTADQQAGGFLAARRSPNDIATVRPSGPASRSRRCSRARPHRLGQLEARLGERVVGQAEAVGAVARAVRRARAGLQDPNRPLGSFLYLGSTGVGKTELARALAELLFDDERAGVIRHQYERVPGEAHGSRASSVGPARLRRLRSGRPADRGGPPPALPIVFARRWRRPTLTYGACCSRRCSTMAG